MATIGWSESAPANGDNLGLGASEIRSLKTAVRTGLDAEHVWPSTGGDAGVHRLGSARAFVGAESAVSSSGTDGRLMVSSNRSRFFHVGSNGTMVLGGAAVAFITSGNATLDAFGNASNPLPQTHYWEIQAQSGTLGSLATNIITYYGSGFSGIPVTWAYYTGSSPTQLIGIHAVSGGKTGCVVYGFTSSGSAPNNTPFQVVSIGSRVLG